MNQCSQALLKRMLFRINNNEKTVFLVEVVNSSFAISTANKICFQIVANVKPFFLR
jgi:hypothetical protein